MIHGISPGQVHAQILGCGNCVIVSYKLEEDIYHNMLYSTSLKCSLNL